MSFPTEFGHPSCRFPVSCLRSSYTEEELLSGGCLEEDGVEASDLQSDSSWMSLKPVIERLSAFKIDDTSQPDTIWTSLKPVLEQFAALKIDVGTTASQSEPTWTSLKPLLERLAALKIEEYVDWKCSTNLSCLFSISNDRVEPKNPGREDQPRPIAKS